MPAVRQSHEKLLQQLLRSPRMMAADIRSVVKLQGVYAWWLVEAPTTCLKVGRARLGARQEGLYRRIRQHLASHEENTVLARHLARDKESPWCAGFNLTVRSERQRFLATKCEFQVLPLPQLSEAELDAFEEFVEARLRPRYVDYVRS